MGSDWASAQIFAKRAAILAELRMSSIAVRGVEGKVHLSSVVSIRSLAFSRHWSFCSCDSVVGGGGVYGGGRTVDRRISVGESSEEWLISAVRAMEMMCWEWEEVRICCVVGVVNVDWGCGWWIVEVYKRFSGRVHWGFFSLSLRSLPFGASR